MRTLGALFIVWFLASVVQAEDSTDNDVNKFLQNTLHAVTRQVMLQQFFTEERIRSEGNSGLKQIRTRHSGVKNYFSSSFTGGSAAAIHNHANNQRTVGMGEFVAVLNGIEFRTRHNDYRLYMPHPTSTSYHVRGNLPFPPVPPEVTAKQTADEQIQEMREFFKAWSDQNTTHRDYRPYFKAALCYLEGAWTKPTKDIDEPFHSDRHFIDASSWFDLMDKIRFTSYAGSKSRLENLAFLPTKITGFINDTLPTFAQWNYRILCHPLENHLPTSRLRVVEDLQSRMVNKLHITRHASSRAARFQLNSEDKDDWYERPKGYQFIDKLMEEIPGKNNYAGTLYDEGLDSPILNMDGKTKKDVSRYHRWFRLGGRDAMGQSTGHRGYSDNYMFAAMTTQDQVAGLTLKRCKKIKVNRKWKEVCTLKEQKWSYAIPLEIIYLNPLYNWNPYNIHYKGDSRSNEGKTVNAGGRTGQCDDDSKAYNGTNSRIYYLTPSSFFSNSEVDADNADTTQGDTCVLDKRGNKRVVRASGTRVFLPSIKGVGILRQRYPIFPVHGEGSGAWKELNAVRDVLMNEENRKAMEWNTDIVVPQIDTKLRMSFSRSSKVKPHTHYVTLAPYEIKDLKNGYKVTVTTSEIEGHSHTLILIHRVSDGNYYYYRCASRNYCWDRHPKKLVEVTDDQTN